MSSKLIIEALEILDMQISEEKGVILNSINRINQLELNFMLNSKNKAFAIKNLRGIINSSKKKIVDLKKRKTIISVA